MNCFQNVSLAYRLQYSLDTIAQYHGCELLSKCIFGISFTIIEVARQNKEVLWIAFKMYLWHIVYNGGLKSVKVGLVVNCFQNVSLAYRLQFWIFQFGWQHVVNCFQNVSLAYRLQSGLYLVSFSLGCELLSKCIFGISFTISIQLRNDCQSLWIAFKMYLWHIVYNLNVLFLQERIGCELLSKCIFGISFTIKYSGSNAKNQLWIAFKMYLWHIVYNTGNT